MAHEQVAYRQDRRMEWLERAFAVGMFLLIPAVIRAQSIPVGSEFQTDSTFTKITTGDIVTTRAWYWNGAWGDYDDDGYLDLFVSNAQTYTNVLYRNDGNDVFAKVTNSGLSERVEDSIASCWADYDNDGFIDLFVTTACYPPSAECQPLRNRLYHNSGDGTFTKVAERSPVDDDITECPGASWGDYDNDGFLDLFVSQGAFWSD